jgi:signal transduction histidine kinase
VAEPTSQPDGRSRSQSLRVGLLALLLRPTARPLGWGVIVAVSCIVAETLVVLQLRRAFPDNAYGLVFLFGVLVVSAGWGFGLAIATTLTSALVYVYFHLEGTGSIVPAVIVFLTVALLANVLAAQARLRTAEAEQRRREADLSHAEASALATQQAALRRVATLVARGAEPAEVYPAAVEELARGLGVAHVTLLRYDDDHRGTVLAARDEPARTVFSLGEHLSLEGASVSAEVRKHGKPARVDDYAVVDGPIAGRLRAAGLRSGAGAPVIVDHRVRGAMIIGSVLPGPLPPAAESGIGDFADLVATAISNAERRTELKASRARIVAAADQARRGFERDLHDGAQQGIVSLGMELRAVEASVPMDQPDLRQQLGRVVERLSSVHTDLQEFSRGIHPAFLSRGGLVPAIKSLARRSAVPVVLDLDIAERPSETVEVATYYVVTEALTNAAKYANASEVRVIAAIDGVRLRVSISDDGIGGAVMGTGSGLIGLKDRVEALSGRLTLTSAPGDGTTLAAEIPVGGLAADGLPADGLPAEE